MVFFYSRRKILVYGTAALGTGMMAACANQSTSQSTSTAQSPAGDTASEGGIIATIKSRGKAVVGLEAAYEPYEFIQDGKIVGYGPDIQVHVAKALGVEFEQLDTPFNGILPGLLAKKFDFVATALNLTEERAKKFAMTMPIMQGYSGALIRKAEAKSLDDFSGKRVGVVTGSAQEEIVRDLDGRLKQEKGQGLLETKGFVSIPDAILALNNKQIDAVFDATDVLGATVAKKPDTYELVYTKENPTFSGWATRAEDKELRDFINVQIQQLQSSGELAKLQEKWFGYSVELPTENYLPAGAI